VGTQKRIRRNVDDAMEEVKRKKRLEKIAAVDSLFEPHDDGEPNEDHNAGQDEQWEEEEEF
jgi:hypothetical protein